MTKSATYTRNFNTPLTTLHGVVLKIEDEGTKRDFLASDILAQYVDTDIQGEKLSGPQKIERYNLARKIKQAEGDVELSRDELNVLEKVIEALAPITLAGQLLPLLDKDTAKDAKAA